jgi:F-type H+-transporting ATPase subunit delta
MAELSTLARPYAKAVFATALEQGKLADWSAMLAFSSVIVADESMKAFIDNPSVTHDRKAEALNEVCEGKLSEQGRNLLSILAENKRLALLPQIATQFDQLKAEQEKAVDVEILTAFELKTEQEEKLAKALAAKLDRKVNLSSKVDRSIIGGAVIRAGDLVIDASVRGKLAKLAEAIGS